MAYDILFFEALGEERSHLQEALEASRAAGRLPDTLSYYIGTETLQEFMAAHPGEVLPDILSTKTHGRLAFHGKQKERHYPFGGLRPL